MIKKINLLVITISIAILIPLVIIAIVGFNGHLSKENFQLELLKTSLNLILIGGLGMLSKELLLDHSKRKLIEEQRLELERLKEVEEHKYRVEALNKLTENYWGIKKALHIIMGHKSAKSYKEQMHLIVDHRLNMQQLHNEVLGKVYNFNDIDGISNCLTILDEKLELLVNEWTKEYLDISWRQLIDEKSPPKDKQVPSMIKGLTELGSIWNKIGIIHDPYQVAAELMRREILKDQNDQKIKGVVDI